jgi:hypothetical protein
MYFAFLSFILLTSLADYIKNDASNYFFRRFLLYAILILFIVIAGGRYYYNISGDWSNYKSYFENSPRLDNLKNSDFIENVFEPGFLVLTGIIKLFTTHYIVFFFTIEIISCFFLFFNIIKYTEYKITTICLYFSLFFLSLDMIMIRSLLAVQIFLFSLRYIYEKKIFLYFICIILASSIHISSIVLLPMYFILNNYYRNRTILIITFIGVMITLLRIDILTPILKLIPSLESISYIYGKINSYLNSGKFGSIRPISFAQIEYIIWFIILMKQKSKLNSYNRYFNIFFNMFFVYGVILFYFIGVNVFSGRIKFFFTFSIVYFIPYFIKIYKKCFSLAIFSYYAYSYLTTIYILYKDEANMILYFGYKNYLFL